MSLYNVAMRQPDGTLTTSTKGKLDIFSEFYGVLYSASTPSMDQGYNFLDTVNITRLSVEHKKMLEESIRPPEITMVINSLKPNKTSGSDGLTGELKKNC